MQEFHAILQDLRLSAALNSPWKVSDLSNQPNPTFRAIQLLQNSMDSQSL